MGSLGFLSFEQKTREHDNFYSINLNREQKACLVKAKLFKYSTQDPFISILNKSWNSISDFVYLRLIVLHFFICLAHQQFSLTCYVLLYGGKIILNCNAKYVEKKKINIQDLVKNTQKNFTPIVSMGIPLVKK